MSGLSVGVLRELFRHLQAWRALYESDGVDVLDAPDGYSYSLWDIEAIYELVEMLPPRQREAIELCLIENIKERDAAIMMGVSPTNPVAMYATSGLEKLVRLVEEGHTFSRRQKDDLKTFGSTQCGWARCRSCGTTWRYVGVAEARSVASKMQEHRCRSGRAHAVA